MRLRPFATLLIVLALAAPAWAQETRGAISGVIKDTSGAVLPGATVEARSATGVVSTTADETGAYRFPALSPGPYKIVATLQGFKPSATKVTVVVGQQLEADLNLAVGGLTETVSVTALATSIDTKQSGAATNIQAETIALLPKGRDFTSLVTLAPGANRRAAAAASPIDGASAAENKYYLDGMDATNLRTGFAATPFLTDFVDEVQVKSSGYAAEFGGSTGGVVSVISRAARTLFRGEAASTSTTRR